MSTLDTAAASRPVEFAASPTAHHLSSFGRSATILDTSLSLERGDGIEGPPQAQLLMVCESNAENPDGVAAVLIDRVVRELLRDDEWMTALACGRRSVVASTIESILATAAKAANEQSSAEASGTPQSSMAITVALVAWPHVVASQVGSGMVAKAGDGKVKFLFQPRPTQGKTEEPAAEIIKHTNREVLFVETWEDELADTDLIFIGTESVGTSLLASTNSVAIPISREKPAKEIANQLLDAVDSKYAASVGVAKLSTALAEPLREVASTSVPDHKTAPTDSTDQDMASNPVKQATL